MKYTHIYIFLFLIILFCIYKYLNRKPSSDQIKEKYIVTIADFKQYIITTITDFKQYIITTIDKIPINDPIIQVFFSNYQVDRIDDNKKLASNINKSTDKEKIYEMVTEYVNDIRTKILELLKNYNKKDIVIDFNKRSDDLLKKIIF